MERNDRLSSCALSSLPMNKLKSLLQKTRKVTLFVWKSIRKNTPLSSEIHCYVRNRKGLHLNRLLSKNLPLCTCNYPFYSAYKSLNHRVNFGQFKLCTDIEKNPGPSVYGDATKTINAPYCQGNVTVFGENAGQQCVAMSLSALIYSKMMIWLK